MTQPLFGEVQSRLSALNTVLQENMAGIKVVRAFAREKTEQARFDARPTTYYAAADQGRAHLLVPVPGHLPDRAVGQAAVLYFGGQQIISGTLTLGE